MIKHAPGNDLLIEQARTLIERQIEHMVRLIDDLLDLGRFSKGKVELRRETVALAAWLAQSGPERLFVLSSSRHRSHELVLTLPQKPIYLDADPTRLAQIISNLLSNAAKYTEKGGHIWLTLGLHGGEAVISVRDTGIGIEAKHLNQIFEMFSQVAPALARSQGGLGALGLASRAGTGRVTRRQRRGPASGGWIGKGSEFIFRLPIALVQDPRETQEKDRGRHQSLPVVQSAAFLWWMTTRIAPTVWRQCCS